MGPFPKKFPYQQVIALLRESLLAKQLPPDVRTNLSSEILFLGWTPCQAPIKSPIAEKVLAAQSRQQLGCGPHSSVAPLPVKVVGIGNAVTGRAAIEGTNRAVGSGAGLITPTPGTVGKPWGTEGLGSLTAKRGRGKKIIYS